MATFLASKSVREERSEETCPQEMRSLSSGLGGGGGASQWAPMAGSLEEPQLATAHCLQARVGGRLPRKSPACPEQLSKEPAYEV